MTDDSAIIQMVVTRLNAHLKGTTVCYEEALKSAPELSGSWVFSFTVQRDGTPRAVEITAKGSSHAGLEACLATHASRWTFSPIYTELPVRKAVSFHP